MNISEANATNTVLRHLLHLATGNGDAPNAYRLNEVRGAAAYLANRAHKSIAAAQVLEALPEYCADKLVDDDGTVRYCFRPAGHADWLTNGQWHDDVGVVWPVEGTSSGGDGRG